MRSTAGIEGSAAVTIREHVLEALLDAGPLGLSMAAIAGTVTGPWRSRDVEAMVRKLWEVNELARRTDGTFTSTGRGRDRGSSETVAAKRSRKRLDRAVARVAAGVRREGYDARITVRTVDPGLLSAFCPGCREVVRPRLDGTCAKCGVQCGANLEEPPKPRRRYRRKPLKEGQAGFGELCRCGARKSKQAHSCRACASKRRSGRQLGPRPTHQPAKNISDELLLEARRLYAGGLSIRQVAERIYPQTSYASVNACKTSLFSLFKTRGWKLRPQSEVTAARNFKHGRKTRARARTGPAEVAYRHWLAAQRGWDGVHGVLRPVCKGVKQQPPGRGKPCTRHALADSEYCYAHDRRFEAERQAACANMRSRTGYREPVLDAAPFAAWLQALHAQLGRWDDVAALIGAHRSAAHRWGTGQRGRVAVRVIERSAENAGTTLEHVYGRLDLDLAA